MDKIILYGTSGSLYTGKARSYLIKSAVPYKEITTSGEHYQKVVKPQAKTPSVPVVEFNDGRVIRDSTLIIDYFESLNGHTFSPTNPRQKIISLLFDVIGSEGLLRPAMHYRWDFLDLNADTIRFFFESMVPLHKDKKEAGAKVMNIMKGAGQAFGAVPENFSVIESLYEEFLQKLDVHFSQQPYLLGGKPSIGDFGLMAPMYAHLGRDPKPLQLMQAKAIHVFRWVERMNRVDADMGEFNETFNEHYLQKDEISQSLIDLLKHIAIDFVPETLAAEKSINEWLASEKPESGTAISRGTGFANFKLRGQTINALAQPYRFFLLKRVQETYASFNQTEINSVNELLKMCDMEAILQSKLNREIVWKDNRELWA